ncbi:sulfotransferase family protein [Inmirania thermothiophila]|uniref:Sulfotransferase family protein n=1 Tax=Inmirania thermothiophila TaxID=1750597 RepID=A0A3N1XSJ6_9GAMM|nr:sulfotransferase [Inmirania thermothiophila]ROR29626.1 sulfotransferase family protein [Inmirania thermothiophila]
MKAPRAPSQRLVFVVGAPRSGTTLLTHMLHRHPLACGTPETHFLCHVHVYPGGPVRFVRSWPNNAEWLCSRLQTIRTPNWVAEPERTFGACLDLDRRDLLGALRRIFLAVIRDAAPHPDAPVLVEKTPQHIQYLALLRRLFPEAAILHIVRDGRAVATSLGRMRWWGSGLTGGLAYWGHWVPAASRWVARDRRALEIRYEALVTDPEATLREVTRFLGLPFSDAMLSPTEDEHALLEAASGYKQNVLHRVDPRLAHAWRDACDTETLRYMDTVLGRVLAQMRYPLETPPRGQVRLVVGGVDTSGRQWAKASELIRTACADLAPGEVLIASPAHDRLPRVPTITCEDFARRILNAPSRASAAARAAVALANAARIRRELHWVRPPQAAEVAWKPRRVLERALEALVTVHDPAAEPAAGTEPADAPPHGSPVRGRR